MKKGTIVLWCIVFVLFFIAPQMIYGIIGTSNSENTENRNMAEFPELSMETIEAFPGNFETYYNDTLPFRRNFIKLNSYFNYLVFKESSVSKVVIGNDGWLFYNPNKTDGDPIADLNGQNLLTNEELEAVLVQLQHVDAKLREQGREFVVMIAPNKESIYGNRFLPNEYTVGNNYTTADQVVEYLRENSDLRVVYPKDKIIAAIEKYPDYHFYYNTDTHWNELGGYIGAKELVEELGGNMAEVSPKNIVYEGELPHGLDLADMMSLGDLIHEKNSYSVKTPNDVEIFSSKMDFSSEFRFSTSSENKKKLLVVRDSFCTAMAEYIAPNYAESVMIYRNIYNPSMLYEENPDIVVIQVVERYVRSLGSFSVSVE